MDEISFNLGLNGLWLKSIKNQTEAICLIAIKQNALALQYVKEQTYPICLAAVKQNGNALQFVKDQTPSHQSWRFIDFRLVVNTLSV